MLLPTFALVTQFSLLMAERLVARRQTGRTTRIHPIRPPPSLRCVYAAQTCHQRLLPTWALTFLSRPVGVQRRRMRTLDHLVAMA